MFERDPEDVHEHEHEGGGEGEGIGEDTPQGGGTGELGGQGGEGAGAEAGTDTIGDDAVEGQTQVDAPEDDVGVPSDESISDEEEGSEQG